MRELILHVTPALLIVAGCSGGSSEKQAPEGKLLVEDSTPVTFDPSGTFYVYNDGVDLALKKVGDERVFHLTRKPPAEKKEEEGEGEGAEAEETPAEEKCTPVPERQPLPGPQEGWHGHPSWSPDGGFIAFTAPWVDGNCEDDDDGDWDIWMVDVRGLDLDEWVEEVEVEVEEGGQKKKITEYYIVGPTGAGLSYYQVTSSPAGEKHPTWASCRSIAFRTESGVRLKDVGAYPGICGS